MAVARSWSAKDASPCRVEWLIIEPISYIRPQFVNGRLQSPLFADHYFGAADAIAESSHHYLLANDLPARFAGRQRFAVAELGFGTGLNFLLTWRAWLEHASATGQLDYLAVEKHPIAADSLLQIFAHWPELNSQGRQLVELYPLALPGCHRLLLDGGRVSLTLVWGGAAEQLPLLDGQFDAWYLDGFSPRSNPEIWSDAVILQVGRLTRPEGSFSTFSVAGAVRRALDKAGFSWQKLPGFGQKGEMLIGKLEQQAACVEPSPWFKWPRLNAGRRVAVIGGGIAGMATAYALTNKQFDVVLVEQRGQLAPAASGNPGGIITPFLAADHSLASQFSTAAFAAVSANIRLLGEASKNTADDSWFHPVGELRLAINERDRDRQQRLIKSGWFPESLIESVDADRASVLAGVPVKHSGLYVASAGWVEPVAWIEALRAAAGERLTTLLSSRVAAINHIDSGWQLLNSDGGLITEADHLVLANAQDAADLLPEVELPIITLRGQIAQVAMTPKSQQISTVLGFGRYLLPADDGVHLLGASYESSELSGLDPDLHQQIVSQVAAVLPDLLNESESTPMGRVSWRAATPDRLPMVGPVSVTRLFSESYKHVHLGQRAGPFPLAEPLPDLYLNIGHGSRGLVSSILCGELLACHLDGRLRPVDRPVLHALHPDRFLVRQLRNS